MPRYFLEVAYKGNHYSGFQKQLNANTIQSELEKAICTLQRQQVLLTGSSRTDAGVHALQNYFHFDLDDLHHQFVYKLNAILPADIVVKRVIPVHATAHCRFDAIGREYVYKLYSRKDPFAHGFAFFYPYCLNKEAMSQAAGIVKRRKNFYAFTKTNSQVKTYSCAVKESHWTFEADEYSYTIVANRFLRGMVRLLTASMLAVGRGKLSIAAFEELFDSSSKSGFSVPSVGLYLKKVVFPEDYFEE